MKPKKKLAALQDELKGCDCSPVYETLIAQKRIGDIWVFSSPTVTTYVAGIYKQRLSLNDPTDADEVTGWIEDGDARKGEAVHEGAFDTFDEAFAWLNRKSLKIIAKEYGGLTPEHIAV